MYTLLKNVPGKKIMKREMPSLGISLLIAEEFYRFGSFILECAAFLATWYVISFVLNSLFVFKPKKRTMPVIDSREADIR